MGDLVNRLLNILEGGILVQVIPSLANQKDFTKPSCCHKSAKVMNKI